MKHCKIVLPLFILSMTIAFAGCKPIPALNPLFEDSERIFEPKLLGEWVSLNSEKDTFCMFHDFDPKKKSYRLEVGGDPTVIASLGKIGDNYFLDVISKEEEALPNKGEQHLELVPTVQGYAVNPPVVLLSDEFFLDFRENQGDPTAAAPAVKIKFQVHPLHTIYKLRLDNNQLNLWFLDDDKFSSLIKSDKLKLAYQDDPFPLIIAGHQDLHEFLQIEGGNADLFSEVGTYCRSLDVKEQ
jgi:hypothetical protein